MCCRSADSGHNIVGAAGARGAGGAGVEAGVGGAGVEAGAGVAHCQAKCAPPRKAELKHICIKVSCCGGVGEEGGG